MLCPDTCCLSVQQDNASPLSSCISVSSSLSSRLVRASPLLTGSVRIFFSLKWTDVAIFLNDSAPVISSVPASLSIWIILAGDEPLIGSSLEALLSISYTQETARLGAVRSTAVVRAFVLVVPFLAAETLAVSITVGAALRLAAGVLFINQAIVRLALTIPAQNVIIFIIVIVSSRSDAQLRIGAEEWTTSCSVRYRRAGRWSRKWPRLQGRSVVMTRRLALHLTVAGRCRCLCRSLAACRARFSVTYSYRPSLARLVQPLPPVKVKLAITLG